MPAANTYSRANVAVLNTRRTPIQKQPETLLCLVELSRRYFLVDDVYPTFLHDVDCDIDLFNLISASTPTKLLVSRRSRQRTFSGVFAVTTGVPVIDVTGGTGVSSPTDMPIQVLSSPEVPMRATPIQFTTQDTQESVVELLVLASSVV
nr:hypothetical protein [Tanacetum cinerariifolium]